MSSHNPPSRFYVLAAIVIAVVIWMVMGAPDSDPATAPLAIARSGVAHR
jgi:hypothetical protein